MSPVTFEWVMAHTEMSQFTLNSLAGNWASSVTVVHMNASCQIWISRTCGGKKGMSRVTCGHGTHVNESCQMEFAAESYIRMRRVRYGYVTRVNKSHQVYGESCHTYK